MGGLGVRVGLGLIVAKKYRDTGGSDVHKGAINNFKGLIVAKGLGAIWGGHNGLLLKLLRKVPKTI